MTRDFSKLFLLAALKKQLVPPQRPHLLKGSALLVGSDSDMISKIH
jgi:hypothetical protein